MVGGDDENIGPVEPERFYARGQRQPRAHGERKNVVSGGQYRCFCCGATRCGHGESRYRSLRQTQLSAEWPQLLIYGFSWMRVQTFEKIHLFFPRMEPAGRLPGTQLLVGRCPVW